MICLLVTCKKTDSSTAEGKANSGLTGKWKLTEYLSDPGDGSGTWQPANLPTAYYLEFSADGTGKVTPGTPYDLSGDTYTVDSDSTMIANRGSNTYKVSYQLTADSLTITGGCIEACGMKFVRVD